MNGSDGLLGNDGNSELTFAHVSKDQTVVENVHYIIIRQTDGTRSAWGTASGTTCAAVELTHSDSENSHRNQTIVEPRGSRVLPKEVPKAATMVEVVMQGGCR